jgi:hypothetical protein
VEFSAENASDFEPSHGDEVFVSGEEMQLLHHAVQGTPYKVVSVIDRAG